VAVAFSLPGRAKDLSAPLICVCVYISAFMWLSFKFWCQIVKASEVYKTVKHIDIVIQYHVFITQNSINHTKKYILSRENP